MKVFSLFILFIIYSILGFLVEVLDTLYTEKKLVNRGFLIGPYCPIYGIGALLVSFLLKNYTNNPLVLLILSIFICAIVEYFVSYLLEKVFNTRWWDYSHKKYNINGRICIENLIPFGIGCLLVIYLLNPFFTKLIDKIPNYILIIISSILFIIFIIDIIVSLGIIWRFRNFNKRIKKDNTEQVSEYVKNEILKTNKKLYKRIVEAFPKLKINIIFQKK